MKIFSKIKAAISAVTRKLRSRRATAPILLSQSDKPLGQLNLAGPIYKRTGLAWSLSRRDRQLDGAAFATKRKLGRAFFRRHINPRTRQRLVHSLTKRERAIAIERGWISAEK